MVIGYSTPRCNQTLQHVGVNRLTPDPDLTAFAMQDMIIDASGCPRVYSGCRVVGRSLIKEEQSFSKIFPGVQQELQQIHA
jgi:hypothetical protein